jgi:hypothetical protein
MKNDELTEEIDSVQEGAQEHIAGHMDLHDVEVEMGDSL